MGKLFKDLKRGMKIRISLPFFSYEVNVNDLLDSTNVDERIAKLGDIKSDLEAAVAAVNVLQKEAEVGKIETNQLKETINKLNEERNTAEALLKLPEESFTRLLTKTSSKGRWRGLIEGVVVGFLTGILSSSLVWYLTK